MPNQEALDRHYLRLAFLIALDRSKDPSTRVGAVLVDPEGRKMSAGYNGMVAGSDETGLWEDREVKYRFVLHAEANCLMNSPFDAKGCTMYCTLAPCAQCLKLIIQAGVRRIVHYGPAWERETQPDVIDRLWHMVEWARYDDDPTIESLKALFKPTPTESGEWRSMADVPRDGRIVRLRCKNGDELNAGYRFDRDLGAYDWFNLNGLRVDLTEGREFVGWRSTSLNVSTDVKISRS